MYLWVYLWMHIQHILHWEKKKIIGKPNTHTTVIEYYATIWNYVQQTNNRLWNSWLTKNVFLLDSVVSNSHVNYTCEWLVSTCESKRTSLEVWRWGLESFAHLSQERRSRASWSRAAYGNYESLNNSCAKVQWWAVSWWEVSL